MRAECRGLGQTHTEGENIYKCQDNFHNSDILILNDRKVVSLVMTTLKKLAPSKRDKIRWEVLGGLDLCPGWDRTHMLKKNCSFPGTAEKIFSICRI